MDVFSDENEDCSGESVIAPFIVQEGSKEFTVKAKKSNNVGRTRIFMIALFATFVILVTFTVGLLFGYFIFGLPKSSNVSSTCIRESICADPPVLLISLDGFRSEYLNRGITPNIKSLADAGVRAEYMKPSFPSKTFPNHYTIVTGLFPEQHGIVDNYFYDRILNDTFSISSPGALDPKWWFGEPIWVTAHNAILNTAVYFWPGSEVPINGILPDIYFKYDGSVPFEERVETVLGWFELPDNERPQFMASYFEEPDHSGHQAGPDSDLVDAALRRVDCVIEKYINGLKEKDIFDCVNIVLLSDHGMTYSNRSMTVTLIPDLLSQEYYDKLQFFSYGIFCSIFIKESDPEMIQEVYNILKQNILETASPVDIYLRNDAPPEYNVGQSNIQRYGDIFLIARIEAYIKVKSDFPSHVNTGQHGYNNSEPQMTTIFIGHGPSFKSGSTIQHFQNIEIYNLLCDLLDIRPVSNNGTFGSLRDALVN